MERPFDLNLFRQVMKLDWQGISNRKRRMEEMEGKFHGVLMVLAQATDD